MSSLVSWEIRTQSACSGPGAHLELQEPQPGLNYVTWECPLPADEGTGNIPSSAPPLQSALLTACARKVLSSRQLFQNSLADTGTLSIRLVLSNPNTNLCCFQQSWNGGESLILAHKVPAVSALTCTWSACLSPVSIWVSSFPAPGLLIVWCEALVSLRFIPGSWLQ